MGLFVALVVLVAAIIWKLRYIKKIDLPVRFQKEPWKLNLLWLGVLIVLWALTGLLFTIFGSPIQHARTFGDAPFMDAIWYILVPALIPTFVWWGMRHLVMFFMILGVLFIINAINSMKAGGFMHDAQGLLVVVILLVTMALWVAGKSVLLFIPKLLFGRILKGRNRRRRALRKPKYHRDQSGRLVRGKKKKRDRRDRRDRDEDDDDDEEDEDDD